MVDSSSSYFGGIQFVVAVFRVGANKLYKQLTTVSILVVVYSFE